jgi:RNA polymerase sigma-70 factor, ECF subfamily
MSQPRIPLQLAAEVAQLYVDESAAVFRYALYLTHGDQEEAENLVQETFQEAARKWAKLRMLSREAQRAWLFTVVKNKAIDRWRVARRHHLVSDVPEHGSAPSAEQVALSRLALDRCWEVISKMSPMQQRVAYLFWHEGWTTREIAEELGITPDTVRVHRKNARDELADAIGDEVVLFEEADDEDNHGEEA